MMLAALDSMDWPGLARVATVLALGGGYNTSLVMIGVAVLGFASGIVGTFAVLRKRAMMSDTLSHATLPGIGLAFLAAVALGVEGRSLPVLLAGAGLAGIAGVGDVRADGTGGWAFVALVDPAVLRDGANALDLYVPDAGGERFSRARPAHAGRPELGRESVVLDGRERPLTPPDDAESLEVARAFTDGRSVTVEGLAVSAGTTRPEDVVLFVHGRPVSSGADPYPTLDEGGAELERWGFVLQVPSDEVGRARHGTLVAIYDDHAAAIAVAWR